MQYSYSPHLTRPVCLYLLLFAALFDSGCTELLQHTHPPETPTYPIQTLRVEIDSNKNVVKEIPLEEYVLGSLVSEVHLAGLDQTSVHRVAELQAILARTYALANLKRHENDGFDLCSTTHCQLYRTSEDLSEAVAHVARKAVRRTTGVVISHNNRPINALFHSDCGGHTSDASIVWGGHTPSYLRGSADVFCLSNNSTSWRFEVNRSKIKQALNKDPQTAIGRQLDRIYVVERDSAGRVMSITLDGEKDRVVRGEKLRAVLTRTFGPRSLKSTRFSISQSGSQVVFKGRGFGHGVGLCQTGAIVRTRYGHSLEEIIAHYYPGTSLSKANLPLQ